MNDEDFFVDDIISNVNKKKKKVNSKGKGNRGELNLCRILCQRFPDKEAFFRVVGSGNRWSQVTLSKHAQDVLTADIVCPPGFRYSIECKYGYDDIELCSIFEGGHKLIDEFLEKTARDADKVKKEPMLCWRKPRYPWLAFIKVSQQTEFMMRYKDWYVVALSELLKQEDSFFFI